MSWLFGGSAVFASFYFPPHQNVEKAHAPLKVHLAALVLHHHCLHVLMLTQPHECLTQLCRS